MTGTDEARRIGDGHGVDVRPAEVRPVQGLVGQGVDGLDVLPGGDLRHDAAIFPVERHLGGDAVRKDLPPVPHHCDGGLIAGGLHG